MRTNIMVGLLALMFILVACSGSPVEQARSTNTSVEQNSEPLATEENEVEVDEELSTQDESEGASGFDPTPSVPFEQDYGPNDVSNRDYSDLDIVTLLPKDAIPAIDDAEYYTVKEANQEYAPDELVIGVEFNGDARAYSVSLLSRHEIVNETVGGVKIAVTW